MRSLANSSYRLKAMTEKRRTNIFRAQKYQLDDDPMIVLVNEGSASAWKSWRAPPGLGRAVVVGTTSLGKVRADDIAVGAMDQACALTTAKYYTPKGRSIQSTGITPDIVVKAQQVAVKAGPRRIKKRIRIKIRKKSRRRSRKSQTERSASSAKPG